MDSQKSNSALLKKLKGAYQVCHDCGVKYGEARNHISSYWNDNCDVCGKRTSVTEARDYGFLWKGQRDIMAETAENQGKTETKTKYVSKITTILVENTESTSVDGLTEIILNDEGAGAYISLRQDTHEITLDREEIDLVYEACKKLLNQ